jgi:HlyD family secretion protein
MKELLSAVGAKPEQIRRVIETAERNRKKPPIQMAMASFSMGGSPGGFPGGMPGGTAFRMQEEPGGAEAGARSEEGRRRGSQRPGGRQFSPEDRQKMQEALKKELGDRKIEDLSQEERQKIFAKLRQSSGGRRQARGEGDDSPPAAPEQPLLIGGGGSQFSEKEMAEAKLPPPPEEDNQLEVLLRPGLLADVEIIIENIPNAIYIPAQAVFEKDGRPVVYVKSGRGFEERSVKFLKQSESTMVVSEGLKPGEFVALSDPTAGRDEKKQEKPAGGPGPMGTSPAGGRS